MYLDFWSATRLQLLPVSSGWLGSFMGPRRLLTDFAQVSETLRQTCAQTFSVFSFHTYASSEKRAGKSCPGADAMNPFQRSKYKTGLLIFLFNFFGRRWIS